MTEETIPKWEPKPMVGCDYDAGKLLDSMRPEMERLLAEMGHEQPPSLSYRAKRAVEQVSERIFQLHGLCAEKQALYDTHSKLMDFLAVHRTVEILERKARA